MNKIYNIICERTDEPCVAEVRSFLNIKNAKTALEKIFNDSLETLDISEKQKELAKKSFEDNKQEAFNIDIYEDDYIQFYARIEETKIEDFK